MSERNLIVVGTIGCSLVAATLFGALNYDKLPFIDGNRDYSAYFEDAAGLRPDSPVEVSGFRVGQVSGITLDGNRVLVNFNLDDGIHVGDRSEAAIKTKTLLGAKFIEITPRGEGQQSAPIPMERTTSPYQLADTLGDLSMTINDLNTDELSQSLSTLAETFSNTPPDLKVAVQGVSRFADTLARRDQQLRSLLVSVNEVSGVLSERSEQIVRIINNANAFLAQLRNESRALDQISGNISAISQQLRGFIDDNRQTFKPALDKLNGVLTILDNRKARIQEAVVRLNAYSMSLGESVSSGPFFKGYVVNLPPGQYIQPFVDAAFSDLGLDPNVLMPSQINDPPTGQPATPALPTPFPRTGQGGEPRMTLPDAITGKPGDPRYPYREPLPAPPPGGPPPGPPDGMQAPPRHDPVSVPAPGESPAEPHLAGQQ
ncbi:MCE family protein [Mycolicibacterium hippocampi]|uniref:Mammalian cell entry protein n=2 Tax=Mycolicibacterium hippocampi TaxID=659824 RepID=A0A7I9ZG72_9MYCO|nr:mammalian cell entry protein [Mycolicibacterium hippocampi]